MKIILIGLLLAFNIFAEVLYIYDYTTGEYSVTDIERSERSVEIYHYETGEYTDYSIEASPEDSEDE